MKKIFFFAIIAFALAGGSCKDEKPNPPVDVPAALKLVIRHTFDGELAAFNNVQYQTTHNFIGVSNLSYYLSSFELQKPDGSWMPIEQYELLVAQDKPQDTITLGNVPKGAYTGIRFSLGVDSLNNHADPSLWPNDHPLSLMRGGQMHWHWNSGYIFLKLEGRFRKDGTNSGLYSYHIGRDDLITNFSFENLNINYDDGVIHLPFKFEISKFFNEPHAHLMQDTALFSHSSVGDVVADILHGNMQGLIVME